MYKTTRSSDPTGRLRKVNIFDVHKILPSEFIVSCIPDEQVLTRKGKYINDPHILKKIMIIDAFLQEIFTNIQMLTAYLMHHLVLYCKYVLTIVIIAT